MLKLKLETLNSDFIAESRKPSAERSRESGFTLMEVLLAVTLAMIVAASCFNIFSMGIQIWKRTQGQSISERKGIIFLEKAGEEIRNMAAVPKRSELGLNQEALMRSSFEYKGEARSFSFPVLLGPRSGAPLSGFGRVTYRWNSGELCREMETASDLYLKKTGGCKAVVTGLAAMKIEYYTVSVISNEFGWDGDWDGKSTPAAVRMRLEFKKDLKTGQSGKVLEKTFLIPMGS